MSLRERIFSLETEYGIQFYSDDRKEVEAETVVTCLIEALSDYYGLPNTSFLVNGSKLHYDVGHPEWSLPECLSAHEAAVYDKTADHLLRTAIRKAERRLAASGYKGSLVVFKNNVDSIGNTFGCHENYLMQKNARMLGGDQFLRYLVRCLVPFLVTRQLLCGTGMLQVDEQGSVSYKLSQRSQFMEAVVSPTTQSNRAIVNVGREKQSLSPTEHRRLHLILGDSNVSGWSTWIKLGTTGLLLRLIEDLYFNEIPDLADPVAALHAISSDTSRSETILLHDGRTVQALDIQWQYYEAIVDYVNEFGMSDDEDAVLDAWGKALEDLSNDADPLLLRNRADWAIKKGLIDATLKNLGYTWDDSEFDDEDIAKLRAIDMRYHDVSDQGYYTKLWTNDTLVTNDEIEHARNHPPAHTRANVRGKAITSARSGDFKLSVGRWTDLAVNERPINLRDPLQFVHPVVPDTCEVEELKTALDSSATEVALRAVDYLGRIGGEENLKVLEGVINESADEAVRQAAIRAIGEIDDCEDDNKISVLIECLSGDVHTRWAAEEALQKVKAPKAPDRWGDSTTAYTDDDEPLVNLR